MPLTQESYKQVISTSESSMSYKSKISLSSVSSCLFRVSLEKQSCTVAITEHQLNESPVRAAITVLANEMIIQDRIKLGQNKDYGRTDQFL